MFEDEAEPRKLQRLQPLTLDRLSVGELQDYITELRAEIARAEADIDRKGRHRDAAEAYFRKA
jgi:uncharacterized small protein (DUF1192 family)